MKKIFVLKGNNDTGKTQKIRELAHWIIINYSTANTNTIEFDMAIPQKDIYGVLTINKLKIGFNSAGDNKREIEKLDSLLNEHNNDIDIIICACRTKGATYQHLYKNYNRSNGWLAKYINVEKLDFNDKINQNVRDNNIIEELKSWLMGLEKF